MASGSKLKCAEIIVLFNIYIGKIIDLINCDIKLILLNSINRNLENGNWPSVAYCLPLKCPFSFSNFQKPINLPLNMRGCV